MALNNYKRATATMIVEKGWDRASLPAVWLLFTEEVGELASAIRQRARMYRKEGMKKDKGIDVVMEMGDVFSYLFQLADMLNVDLDQMWELHRQKMNLKKYNRVIL